MNVCSLGFLISLAIVSGVLFRLPRLRQRQAILATCSAGFLLTHLPNPLSWWLLFAILLSGYACARLLVSRPNRLIFTTYLVTLVSVFTVLKKYEFLHALLPGFDLDHSVEIVGLSYMLFRQIHFIVDSMQGQIETASLWDYLNYQLNPFTLLAGPIPRYQHFLESWQSCLPLLRDRHEVMRTYQRLFGGILKVAVLSAGFLYLHGRLLDRFETQSIGSTVKGLQQIMLFAAFMYCYTLYLYMNFSGYCDIVIAGASLVGLKLPENFNWPFLSRNLLEYWTRWHITLGFWIRDYLFTPLYKSGIERWPDYRSSLAVISYFVAFTLAGIWHGSHWNFLVFGLLHGTGVSAAKLWENLIIRYSGRAGLRSYLASQPIRCAAVLFTFHYVCMTLFFFAYDLDRCMEILRRLVASF